MRIRSSNGEPFDFCDACFSKKDEEQAEKVYGSLGSKGDGTSASQFDCDSPDYGEAAGTGEPHICQDCYLPLTEVDGVTVAYNPWWWIPEKQNE